jgi:hypothetical protein
MVTENNRLKDQSADQKYFTITPRIVWAMTRDPYELTLWHVVKMIAGENGECFISTEDLAAAAMMSTGKVSQCRKRLIKIGLLEGEIRRDPGYRQAVWHLTIPDLWALNISWSEQHRKLKDRIDWKREQKENKGKSGQTSLHVVKPSRGEAKPSRGETKKNQEEEQHDGGGINNKNITTRKNILTAFGVAQSVAKRLAKQRSTEEIQGWVDYAKQAKGLRNPVAFVVSRLQAGEPVPEQTKQNSDTRSLDSEGKYRDYIQT